MSPELVCVCVWEGRMHSVENKNCGKWTFCIVIIVVVVVPQETHPHFLFKLCLQLKNINASF